MSTDSISNYCGDCGYASTICFKDAKPVNRHKPDCILTPQVGRLLKESDVGSFVVRVFPTKAFKDHSSCIFQDWSYIPAKTSKAHVELAARKVVSVSGDKFKYETNFDLIMLNVFEASSQDGHKTVSEESLEIIRDRIKKNLSDKEYAITENDGLWVTVAEYLSFFQKGSSSLSEKESKSADKT